MSFNIVLYANSMQMETVHTKVLLDTRRKKKENNYPVKLRLTHGRTQKYYPMGLDLSEIEWKKVMGDKPRKSFKEKRLKIDSIKQKAENIIKELDPFDFTTFNKKFLTPRADAGNVYAAFQRRIDELKAKGQLSTAICYRSSLNSLKLFKETLYYKDVTAQFLIDYHNWMKEQGSNKSTKGDKKAIKGNSNTTISIYLRCLRSIINKAISEGEYPKDNYPFGKYKYTVPASRNIKKSLTLEEIGLIQNFEPLKSKSLLLRNAAEAANRAKDYWLFSYYVAGINFKDIALLKRSNISGDYLLYQRAKTERTAIADMKKASAPILPQIREIIKRQGVYNIAPDSYLFPILSKPGDAVQVRRDIQQFIKTTNKYMKLIAKELEIEKPITTYYARHSYATILMRAGAPVAYISEKLAHHNIKTTQNYLGSFENDTDMQFAQKLIPAVIS